MPGGSHLNGCGDHLKGKSTSSIDFPVLLGIGTGEAFAIDGFISLLLTANASPLTDH